MHMHALKHLICVPLQRESIEYLSQQALDFQS